MGGHGINTRHVPNVSILLNGNSLTTYFFFFYVKPNKDLLLSREKKPADILKLKMVKSFQDTDSHCMVRAPSSLGIHIHFICLQDTSAENLRSLGARKIPSMVSGT